MHLGKLVFAQLMDHLPLHIFRRCVAKYPGRYPALTFSHLDQFLGGTGSVLYFIALTENAFSPSKYRAPKSFLCKV
jgi:hypothetical protein